MSQADVEYVKGTVELFLSNDRDGALARWAENCVAISPAEWPEAGTTEGREQVRALFEGFDEAFGADWPTRLSTERLVDAGEGRILVEFGWEPSGASSGASVQQPISCIYTVEVGEIVRADFFLGHEQGRKAAGLE